MNNMNNMNNTNTVLEILVNYIPETNLRSLLNKETRYLIKMKIANLFDIDFKFIKQAYSLNNYTNSEIITYVRENNYINHIFHPKQLYNLFKDKIKLLNDKDNCIQVKYNDEYYILSDFITKIHEFSYDKFKHLSIQIVENCDFTENNLLLLFYIGNEKNFIDILIKIKNYYNIQEFSLAFCIHHKLVNTVLPIIKEYFSTNFIVYSSNEAGNDIVPSLLAYDEIVKNFNYTFNYIIKIHTKSDTEFLQKATDYLLNSNLNDLLLKNNTNSSSIGFDYIQKKNDPFNTNLCSQFIRMLVKKEFVPGTIFLTTKCTFDKVMIFFKDNYKTIFLQNMYDNNSLNKDTSYVHFMERLFGYLQ